MSSQRDFSSIALILGVVLLASIVGILTLTGSGQATPPATDVAGSGIGIESTGGELRHLDEADIAVEDAAGTSDSDPLDAWCVGAFTCGIVTPRGDPDNATGSFHQACIINTSMTHTNDAPNITWMVTPVSGSPLPIPVAIIELSGPHGEPCLRWGSGFTGVQYIFAVYDNGIDPEIEFYFDSTTLLPLIAEWNSIDTTRIVEVSGQVGDDLFQNTGDLSVWADRDCSSVPTDPGLCTRPNVDGATLQHQSSLLGGMISAPPRSFIDYASGSHSDGAGQYNGPIDGAEQTYTMSGDCGSVRLEDPQNGSVIILSNSGLWTGATVLSSDKGVGFTFVPNDDGSITTTLANADCGPNAEICIDISTEEDNLFSSGPLDDAPNEGVCVQYTLGPTPAPTTPAPTTPAPTTPAPTTPAPTTPAPQLFAFGDADCIGGVADPIDALRTLRHDAGLAVFQLPGCPPLGATALVDGIQRVWGDVNCGGDVNPVDGLLILRYDAGLSVNIPPDCVQIGQEVLVE